MKKFVAVLLSLILLLPCVAVFGEEAPIRDYTHLTVGTLTDFSGNFYSRLFGSNTSDLDIQRLLHGYQLVYWNNERSTFDFDPTVVKGSVISDNAAGDRTYNIVLNGDLVYSDGTPITAWDYAFDILLNLDPAMARLTSGYKQGMWLLGSEAYCGGTSDTLKGVRVYSDTQFSVTVSSAYRPFFYELGYLSYLPRPASVLAEGNRVLDKGEGVCLEKPLDSDALAEVLFNETSGYVTWPSVVSGPYTLVSFDGETAELEANPNYIGNWHGVTPAIRYLSVVECSNEDGMAKLAGGEIDLLNKCLNTLTIDSGIQLVAEEEQVRMQTYPRSGYSFLSFCCENPKVSDVTTRQAIALCLDKDQLVTDYTGNYGIRADGYFGIGQWMYRLVNGTLDLQAEDDKETERIHREAEKLNLEGLNAWNIDLAQAEKLLTEAGWTLNQDGAAFDPESDALRYREQDGELIPFSLTLLCADHLKITDIMEKNLGDNLRALGGELHVTVMPFSEVLQKYYHQSERDCEMMFLGSNFSMVFDPSEEFNPANIGTIANPTDSRDEELYQLARNMSATEAGDVIGYCEKWVRFQEKWSELLPAIPLYSNAYFDFHTAYLQDYKITEFGTWAEAIVESYLSDYMTEEDEQLPEDDDMMIFDD